MPKGPKGEKRPADVVGAAVRVAQIATVEAEEEVENDAKDPAANALGKKGGKARAAKLTKDRDRRVVVVLRQRAGRTLPFVVKREAEGVAIVRQRIEAGSEVHADEAAY